MTWTYVRRRFQSCLGNLALTDNQIIDGRTKLGGIVSSLNRSYWDTTDAVENAFVVGSWGKDTAISPPTDIDLFFLPPVEVYERFNDRAGNVQSQLLQEVKSVLEATYRQTDMRGDGQVVVVGFNSVTVEVVPAFRVNGGGYYICDTHDGGRWKHVDTIGEINDLDTKDKSYFGNVRKLTKIIKQWNRYWDAQIKSFHIEQLVKEALANSNYGFRDEYWFDWLVRDVFTHMAVRAGGSFFMPGLVFENIEFGDAWRAKAEAARDIAILACVYEERDMEASAGLEWQKLLGTKIPATVT